MRGGFLKPGFAILAAPGAPCRSRDIRIGMQQRFIGTEHPRGGGPVNCRLGGKIVRAKAVIIEYEQRREETPGFRSWPADIRVFWCADAVVPANRHQPLVLCNTAVPMRV